MSFLKEVLRGIAIGVANIIPGVSGGTMMVSMGIYGDVIGAVTGMPKHFWKSVKFLLPYAIGMLIGIGGLSFAIGYFFLEFPFETAMLFIGLIFGGVPLLLPKIMGKRITFSEALLFVLFFGLVVWMQFWKQGTDVALEPGIKNSISLFTVGTVAAATMVIPGVSGSMLLMSLGYYTPIINRISGFWQHYRLLSGRSCSPVQQCSSHLVSVWCLEYFLYQNLWNIYWRNRRGKRILQLWGWLFHRRLQCYPG